MGTNYRHDRLSANFINLTDETIRLYEICTGEIWVFPPSDGPIPKSPVLKPDELLVHYIVRSEMAEELGRSGRPLDDIAVVVDNNSIGRNGHKIASLIWGKKPDIDVRLYRNFKQKKYD